MVGQAGLRKAAEAATAVDRVLGPVGLCKVHDAEQCKVQAQGHNFQWLPVSSRTSPRCFLPTRPCASAPRHAQLPQLGLPPIRLGVRLPEQPMQVGAAADRHPAAQPARGGGAGGTDFAQFLKCAGLADFRHMTYCAA